MEELPKPASTDVEAKDTGQFASANIPAQANGVLQQQNLDKSLAQNASAVGAAPSKETALHVMPGTTPTLTPTQPRNLGVSDSKLWMRTNRANTTDRHRKAA